MTPSQTLIQRIIPPDPWNEELSRATRFREATQKRSKEKQALKEIEQLRKTSKVGRLKIEP